MREKSGFTSMYEYDVVCKKKYISQTKAAKRRKKKSIYGTQFIDYTLV